MDARLISLLFLVFLAAPIAMAQDAPMGWSASASDPTGDTEIEALSGTAPGTAVPTGPDLLRVSAVEEPAELTIAIEVALGGDPSPLNGWVYTWLELSLGEARYAIAKPAMEQGVSGPALYVLDSSGEPRFIESLAGTSEATATRLTIGLPREFIRDHNAAPPLPGSSISIDFVRVASGSVNVAGAVLQAFDTLDDPGPLTGSLQLGLAQTGPVELSSPAPYRASNGEVGTFVYELHLRNKDSHSLEVLLQAENLPQNWRAFFPGEGTIRLPAHGEMDTFAIITTPFAHRHGETEEFIITAEALDREGTSSIELGVRYLPVPQPAGHHDTLYLHSLQHAEDLPLQADLYGGTTSAFMSTLPEDPKSAFIAVKSDSFYRPLDRIVWTIPLDPQLGIGLEFDDRQGELTARFETSAPLQSATLVAQLILVEGSNDRQVVATSPRQELGDLGLQEQIEIELPIEATPNRYPYSFGSKLLLEIEIETLQPTYVLGAELPALLPGGSLRLPLLEYQDPLPASLEGFGDLLVEFTGRSQRLANPGSALLIEATATNQGASPAQINVAVEGSASPWTTLLSPQRLTVAPGGSEPIHIRLDVPPEARQNDLLEMALIVSSADESAYATVLKYAVIVDERQSHEDDAEILATLATTPGTKSTPALATGYGLVVMGLGASLLRRRHSKDLDVQVR